MINRKGIGKCRSLLPAIVMGVSAVSAPLFAYPPTFLIGSSAEYSDSSEYDGEIWYDVYGMGEWRTILEPGGYFSIDGKTSLAYSDVDGGTVRDDESINAELGLRAPGGEVELRAGLDSSLDDRYYGTTLRPQWGGEYRVTGNGGSDGTLAAYLGYSGYYLYQEDGAQDRLSHAGSFGVDYEPSIKRGYTLELSAEHVSWSEEYRDYLEEVYAVKTGTDRQDLIFSGMAEARGLAGFFADWRLSCTAGTRVVNDQRYFDEIEEKQYGSDRMFGNLEAGFNWSPVREMSLSALLYADGTRYLKRRAYTKEGVMSESSLVSLDLGGSLSADWTPNDELFFVLELFGGKRFSNDSDYESWNFGLRGGIEYGF